MANDTFLDNVDTGYLQQCFEVTQQNVEYFDKVTDSVVRSYTEHLDSIMENIRRDIIEVENVSTEVLEKYFLELSNDIYFTGAKLEKLGIYDSMSKAAYKEVYNKAYLDNQLKDSEKKNKTTVAENQAVAEGAAIYESAVNDIYNKSYKIVKMKIDAAQTMVSTLSKAISRRMTENQFSNMNNNGRQILNEEITSEGTWRSF